MSNDVQWIAARIAKGREKHDAVTDAVADRMENLLGGELSERPLPQAKLRSIASLLIEDMVSAPPEAEAKE